MPEIRGQLISLAAVLALVLSAPFCIAQTNSLEGVRVHDAPTYTRVVLDTRFEANYQVFMLDNPERVVVDLDDTAKGEKLVTGKLDSRVVAGIRRAQRQQGKYRVVLDLKQQIKPPEPFVLNPVRPYGHRLVVDLYWDSSEQKSVVQAQLDGQRDVVVAIDAGHGGEDPGAIGVNKVLEKNVVLSIARTVKRRLDATAGFKAVLVRDGDYYVPLRKRPRLAREARADFFVSIRKRESIRSHWWGG